MLPGSDIPEGPDNDLHPSSSREITSEPLTLFAGILAFLAVSLWGGNTVSIKIASAGVPPAAIAAARFALGALAVFIYSRTTGVSLTLFRAEISPMLKLSALFVVQILFLNIAASLTLAAHATVLISSYPFFVALFAHLLIPNDHLTGGKVTGMLVSFAGVLIIFSEALFAGSGSLRGDMIALLSCVLLGLRQVVTKRMVQGINPVKLVFWQSLFSIPAFILINRLFERDFTLKITPGITAALLYQGLVVAGLCFLLMASLLRRYNTSAVSSFSFFTPLVGVLLSGLLLSEPLSPRLVLSLVLIAAGIVIVNRYGRTAGD